MCRHSNKYRNLKFLKFCEMSYKTKQSLSSKKLKSLQSAADLLSSWNLGQSLCSSSVCLILRLQNNLELAP